MSNRSWLSDFNFRDGAFHVKKTGHAIPANLELLHSIFAWLSFYTLAQAWRTWRMITGYKRPTIAFYPDKPRPWYFIWPVMHVAGAKLTEEVSKADIVFQFDDATQTSNDMPKTKPGARLVNFNCNDISKSKISTAYSKVFERELLVNPKEYKGKMVEKSEVNAAHDGKVVEGPKEPLEGKVYQRLINNEVDSGLVEDLRCCLVGGKIAVMFRKRRPVEERFRNSNTKVSVAWPRRCFSLEEVQKIEQFADYIGLDWGGVDVLRDKESGQIFIVDANKTDMGPPVALNIADKLRSTRLMGKAFLAAFATKRKSLPAKQST